MTSLTDTPPAAPDVASLRLDFEALFAALPSPYMVLDRTKYMTIPIHIQYLQGSYGHVDLGAVMALIMLSIIPIVIFYLFCQKYIVSGVMAGAVKG